MQSSGVLLVMGAVTPALSRGRGRWSLVEWDGEVSEVERLLEMGDWEGARGALLAWLAERVAVGDETARVVVRVLGAGRFSADGVAGVVDRLVAVTEAQEGQIRALMTLLEGRL